MSGLWTAADAAAATGGQAHGDWTVAGLSIDSRDIAPGELFVALTDKRDGHDFVADALAKGAGAAMVSRIPDGVPAEAPLLLVDDVQGGLEALARAGRARTAARVVGVTGSVGKTSTKEMLRCALGALGRVHAAEKSFNNHWGVPLTLARCPADADYAVVEIGMNHPGEIAPLAAIARPDVALVTAVAPAHLEAFTDGLEGIAREKASIFSGLAPGGTAVLNADLETTPILRDGAAGAARVLAFGCAETADIALTDLVADADGSRFTCRIGPEAVSVQLRAPGTHHAMNAAAVLGVVHALGGDLPAAVRGLLGWAPGGGRGARERIAAADGNFELIDDAYNANPASVGAALAVLAAALPAPGGRRVAVLGDMLELGPAEARLHAGLADDPAMPALDVVHCTGPRMRHLFDALPPHRRGLWREDAEGLAEAAGQIARPGDVVLVKGSLGARTGRVVEALRGLAAAKQTQGAV